MVAFRDESIGVILLALTDADFAAMLRGDANVRDGLASPPGGVDEPAVLEHVRRLAANLHRDGYVGGQWMMVASREVVGLCGFKTAPSSGDGDVEIGYSVAASRRRRGHASAAVGAVIEAARQDSAVRALVAVTSIDNIASHAVLKLNGFERIGTRVDPDEGEEIVWRRPV
jgi:RimJ/RimL family protein N-acetyltransferase